MTMTMPSEALLDWLDFSPVCALQQCDHAADWWMVCRACNRHVPWCEPCRRRETAKAVTAGRQWLVGCLGNGGCGETVRSNRWRELFDLVPIRST